MKIVVLDDSRTIQMTLMMLLEEQGVSSTDIYLFSDGEKALASIEEQAADIIFSDIQMPGMDGFEFVTRLLQISPSYLSSLIVVSADEETPDTRRMKELGTRFFLKKPIDSETFNTLLSPFLAIAGTQVPPSQTSRIETANKDFDPEQLAQKLGISARHIPRLIESFHSEAAKQLESYRKALPANDFEQLRQSAHAIKGSAGNMQLSAIYDAAKEAEEAAYHRNASFPYAEYADLIEEVLITIPRPVG